MADKFDLLNAIAREARQINAEFHRMAREAYQFARAEYADPRYEAFRDSDAGKAWKQRKLVECNHRCPICTRLINDRNSNIDHKHPRRYYPWLAWDIDNLWVICRTCNEDKADLLWDVYLVRIKARFGQAAIDRIAKYAPPATVDRE
jgi:5-methylcytosine-specific restriction endonuclease McrA